MDLTRHRYSLAPGTQRILYLMLAFRGWLREHFHKSTHIKAGGSGNVPSRVLGTLVTIRGCVANLGTWLRHCNRQSLILSKKRSLVPYLPVGNSVEERIFPASLYTPVCGFH